MDEKTNIRLYEVPDDFGTYGDETFLREVNMKHIPRVDELIGFEDSLNSYRVVDVSYFFDYDCEDYTIEMLVCKE